MIENDKHDRACESTGLLGLRGLKLVVRCGYSITTLCFLLLLIFGSTANAADAPHPLAPPDTSSPRATLNTFLNEMNKAVDAYKAGHRDQARAFLDRAVRCLNLDAEPPALRPVLGSVCCSIPQGNTRSNRYSSL